MGKIELDHTGSGSGITLSSDGTDLLLDGTAIGGGGASAQTIDIKTADYTIVSGDLGKIIKYFGAGADRTVTLTAGATLGEGFHVTILNANSGADERVVIDANSTERFGWSNGPQTITLSRGELVRIIWDNTGGRWIIGEGGFNLSMRSDINPATTTAAGDGANGAIALGQNSLATGSQAVSLGRSLASNSYAFAAAIATNSSSYGASGSNSIAGGDYNKATATDSLCWGGDSNVAQSGAKSTVVGGWSNICSGAYSFIGGGRGNKITSGSYSRAGGLQADVNGTGIDTWSSGRFSSDGDAQTSKRVLIANTTDATATVLGTQNINSLAANQVTLPNNSAFAFHGTIVARQQAADGTACAAWKVEGLIRREANAGTTVLVNSATTVLDNTPNWGMALSANTSLGCLKIEVTGAASTDIRWVATIHTSEVTYA
tara:strand:- start:22 stop:1317 length:1296 start_codon:yes stop_codon:yes gene_type:complete